MMQPLTVVVLAAGKGTRMKSGRAKVLHQIAGRTLLGHVLEAAAGLGAGRAVVVVAPGMDEVAAEVACGPLPAQTVVQEPRLGTGHAVMVVRDHLPPEGTVLVLYGDTPLIQTPTLRALLEARNAADAAVAVLGMRPPDTTGYGRFVWGEAGLEAIVEARHADPDLLATGICNAGIMALDAARLGSLLDALELHPEKQEYYLTDVVEQARLRGYACTAIEGPWEDGVGVNSQAQLATAEGLIQGRLRMRALEDGVTMTAPETVFLNVDTRIEPGVEIGPNVVFGPGVTVDSGARILPFCHLEGVRIKDGAVIGPFARLRPGTEVEQGARVGNFVEIKNGRVEPGAKVNHLTYIGDTWIGPGANIGAGTITCNYDGFAKHRTEIGAGAFIGSNSALVAPVRIGADAIVGAGSVITQDVPAGDLAVARGRQRNLAAGATSYRAKVRREK